MATLVITPEIQRANAEVLLGKDPGKYRDPGHKWSMNRYREKLRDIKQLGKDFPMTILNLNVFPLKINGGMLFPDEVAACEPGKPYAIHVIKEIGWTHSDQGCDAQNMMQMDPIPFVPLVLATEYVRQYMQEGDGYGGVLVYAGDKDPATIKKGEQVDIPEVAFDNGEFYVQVKKRDFHELLARVKSKRNGSILREVQLANAWYENDSQRMNVNDRNRDVARLAVEDGLIPALPRWVLQANMLPEKQADPCPSCQVIPKPGAILCQNCGDIFNVIEAFKRSRIRYEAVEMERLTAEEWKVANQIHAERQKAKGKVTQ